MHIAMCMYIYTPTHICPDMNRSAGSIKWIQLSCLHQPVVTATSDFSASDGTHRPTRFLFSGP